MQLFTGKEYVKIAVANAYGLDKLTWKERLDWFDTNKSNLFRLTTEASEPILYRKALNAWKDTVKGIPTGFIMGLDSTSSGVQIMSALSGDPAGAANTNLIDTGERKDFYSGILKQMGEILGHSLNVTRKQVKEAGMTVMYGSKAKPKEIFGEDTVELAVFYESLYILAPGAMNILETIQACWNPIGLSHEWTLPDGHKAIVNVMVPEDKKIEIDELGHKSFTHRAYINAPDVNGLSLAANVTHSIDAYIVRELVRRTYKKGFEMATIHDSFWCSPNHMNDIRVLYNRILKEIAESNLLQDILNEITGNSNGVYVKFTNDLGTFIENADYALS